MRGGDTVTTGQSNILALLRAARIRKLLTQAKLAESLYVSQSTVSNFELGKSPVPDDFLELWCAVLGVKMPPLE